MITPRPPLVSDEEKLARFVLTDGWLYKDERPCKVRPIALIPNPHTELSVYRIDGWTPEEIKTEGESVASARENRHRQAEVEKGNVNSAKKQRFRYLGLALLTAKAVRLVELDVLGQEPPIGHANIVGWPPRTGNKKLDESAQLAKALRLIDSNLVGYEPA